MRVQLGSGKREAHVHLDGMKSRRLQLEQIEPDARRDLYTSQWIISSDECRSMDGVIVLLLPSCAGDGSLPTWLQIVWEYYILSQYCCRIYELFHQKFTLSC